MVRVIHQVGRWLVALAVVLTLGFDDFDQEGQLDKPSNIDPTEWALYNARSQITHDAISGLPAPEPGVIVIEPYQASPRNALTELQRAINGAVDVLQQGGERENRAATQLLTTMALYEQEIGR